MTAAARVAWNTLDTAKKEVVLPKLREVMRERHVALGRQEILRTAGLK